MVDRMLLGLIVALIALDVHYTRRWLRASRRELEQLRRSTAQVAGFGGADPLFRTPNYCGDCGARLEDGGTKHRAGCEIQMLIDMARGGAQ